MDKKEKKRLYDIEYRAKNKDRIKKRNKLYYNKNMDTIKSYQLKKYWENPGEDNKKCEQYRKKFGFSLREIEFLTEEQNNKCYICGNEFDNKAHICIDHNHSTGETRGIICRNCNSALGMVKDNIYTLIKMISYVNNNGYLSQTVVVLND